MSKVTDEVIRDYIRANLDESIDTILKDGVGDTLREKVALSLGKSNVSILIQWQVQRHDGSYIDKEINLEFSNVDRSLVDAKHRDFVGKFKDLVYSYESRYERDPGFLFDGALDSYDIYDAYAEYGVKFESIDEIEQLIERLEPIESCSLPEAIHYSLIKLLSEFKNVTVKDTCFPECDVVMDTYTIVYPC